MRYFGYLLLRNLKVDILTYAMLKADVFDFRLLLKRMFCLEYSLHPVPMASFWGHGLLLLRIEEPIIIPNQELKIFNWIEYNWEQSRQYVSLQPKVI